ncbi:hypothetical protein ANO11243_012550 [Dothideomycetidae sp. 11243]|nr:hypothetical protein ANO11243_012550 [fungal sp. No.11243]
MWPKVGEVAGRGTIALEWFGTERTRLTPGYALQITCWLAGHAVRDPDGLDQRADPRYGVIGHWFLNCEKYAAVVGTRWMSQECWSTSENDSHMGPWRRKPNSINGGHGTRQAHLAIFAGKLLCKRALLGTAEATK